MNTSTSARFETLGVALAAGLGLLWGCSDGTVTVHGKAPIAQELRAVGSFTAVVAEGELEIVARVAPTTGVILEGHGDLLQYVECNVEGRTLRVRTTPGLRLAPPPRIEVSAAALDGVELLGSGTLRALDLRGARLAVALRGSGDIELTGAVDRLELDVEGSGDVHASGLVVAAAEASIVGSGGARLNVREHLEARVIGSGRLGYEGAPAEVESTVTGSGDVVPVDPR